MVGPEVRSLFCLPSVLLPSPPSPIEDTQVKYPAARSFSSRTNNNIIFTTRPDFRKKDTSSLLLSNADLHL